MKRVRDILQEAWEKKPLLDPEGKQFGHEAHSRAVVHGQQVHIRALHIPGSKDVDTEARDSHSISYSINGETSRNKANTRRLPFHKKMGIVRHVASEVDDYIKQERPKSLVFSGSGGSRKERAHKDKLYSSWAKSHGGSHSIHSSIIGKKNVHRLDMDEDEN